MAINECPCGWGRTYEECCGRFHSGLRQASTAEELMRSRYSAFVLVNPEYLLRSWHPDTRPATVNFDENRVWTGLVVMHTEAGGPLDMEGIVEFKANYKSGSRRGYTHEASAFSRVDGRWVYVDDVEGD